MKKRIDDNQTEIVDALRKIGCSVQSIASVGGGCPDILIGTRNQKGERVNYIMEIKDGNKPLSRRKLTPDEEKFYSNWRGQIAIVKSVDEALDIATQ